MAIMRALCPMAHLMKNQSEPSSLHFKELNLNPAVLRALEKIGYERPSPIQAQIIPHLIEGKDVLGQAQTGTGKTAAFALPLLSSIDLKAKPVQVLVLTPTRELAIQVSEAIQSYARFLDGFHVLPIYGGQDYKIQLKQLKRSPQVVVGTPGRVMDHMRRGALKLDQIQSLVLDEADEMLRMGFIDDVEWVLDQCPEKHQLALFSATMPKPIHRIAQQYLKNPVEVKIKVDTSTPVSIRQRVWFTPNRQKMDSLTRILEVEPFDAMIIFVRTRSATVEVAEKLQARGHACAYINGDMQQKQRERTVNQLKKGQIDILVATDVAARGLDVERISHVFNFDIPNDTEAYVHRIGRTGRAGRSGDAILFVTPREKRLLQNIEKATRQKIDVFKMPSLQEINTQRIEKFSEQVQQVMAEGKSQQQCRAVIENIQQQTGESLLDIAAALVRLAQGDKPLILQDEKKAKTKEKAASKEEQFKSDKQPRRVLKKHPTEGMEYYRIEVGAEHDAKPSAIVGAIANETGLESEYIGRIEIFPQFTVVELPQGMPGEMFRHLKKVRVAGRALNISHFDLVPDESGERKPVRKKKKNNVQGKKKKNRRDVSKRNHAKKKRKKSEP